VPLLAPLRLPFPLRVLLRLPAITHDSSASARLLLLLLLTLTFGGENKSEASLLV
jgi:hypothetical protein